VARGMDGLKATGNGWVPKVAARAVRILTHNAGVNSVAEGDPATERSES
jgi:hypothetical protein